MRLAGVKRHYMSRPPPAVGPVVIAVDFRAMRALMTTCCRSEHSAQP